MNNDNEGKYIITILILIFICLMIYFMWLQCTKSIC